MAEPIRAERIIGNFSHVEPWREIGEDDNPDFEGTWANYSGSETPCSFYKDPFGEVHIRGFVDTGSGASIIFTLPEGYRPDYSIRIGVLDGGTAIKYVRIETSGEVRLVSAAYTTWISLDVISFREHRKLDDVLRVNK